MARDNRKEQGARERPRAGSEIAPWASSRAQRRLAELEARFSGRPPGAVAKTVRRILEAHAEEVEDAGIILYAGTNTPSPLARGFLGSTVETRPSMGYPGEKYQTYLRHVEELEVLVNDLARRAFRAAFAETRIQSGTLANLAVYSTFCEPGDSIAVLPESAGGHISHHAYGAPGIRGVRVAQLPYDAGRMNLDLDLLRGFLARHRPKLVVLGASFLLYAHPVSKVRELADEIGALVVYDAAHVDGLISGGHFQQPLAEGAHLITSSTYKSLGGPSGGMILTDDPELAEKVSTTVYPGMTANYDVGRLGALAVALAESLEFGEAYARACIANARELARSLDGEGFVVAGAGGSFTDSHHVGIDAGEFGGGEWASRKLASAGIYASGIGLPWQGKNEPYRGIRLGTQEVTRRGLKPEHMRKLARWIGDVLVRGRDATAVRCEVSDLRRAFSSFEYCYEVPGDGAAP